MRLAQAVRLGAWFLVGINLLLAVGSIAIFTRMAPAIANIIERNDHSLKACEDMLAVLARPGTASPLTDDQAALLRAAVDKARSNITEAREPEIIAKLESALSAAISGDSSARQILVTAAVHLSAINRDAMLAADQQAQRLGRTGAWGVVFMALSSFLVGIIFIQTLTRRVVHPLEEIHAVIRANRNGDALRRCTGSNLPLDMAMVFSGINSLLDQCQAQQAQLERDLLASGNNP